MEQEQPAADAAAVKIQSLLRGKQGRERVAAELEELMRAELDASEQKIQHSSCKRKARRAECDILDAQEESR